LRGVFVLNTAEMAKVSARGGFSLFWGLVASTVISAVGVIVIARLLSPSEYGLVTVALAAPGLVTLFRDWGVNSAMIKYTAQYRSENRISEVKNILAAGLSFELTSGLLLSIILFLLSDFIATKIFNRPETTQLIQAASFIVFAGALLTVSQSLFTGYEKMEFTSITMICQSISKTFLAPILILFGFGAFGAVLGSMISVLAAGLVGILLLYAKIYRKINASNDGLKVVETLKTMLKFGLPLSISSILGGFLSQFYNFLVVIYCADALIGNYSVATNFIVLITFFSTPISTVLFPAFSKLNPEHEDETLRSAFQLSVKYASLIVVPVAAALMALSQPALTTLFGEKYSYAPSYLTLLAISYLYTAFGSLSVGNLIISQGETKFSMKLSLITVAVGLPLSLILIPKLGIIGLILTTLVAGIPSLSIALWYVKRHYGATIDWTSSTKILSASIFSASVTHLILTQLPLPSWTELALGAIAFLTIYIISVSLIGAVKRSDIENIKEMMEELGPISKLLNPPLNIIEKLIQKIHRT